MARATVVTDAYHVPLTFGISAAASGPDSAAHMQVFVDGVMHADYPNVKTLPSGTTIALSTSGTHRIAVQTLRQHQGGLGQVHDYVTNP